MFERMFVIQMKSYYLRRPNICPDGGIGRRAGLKHQWPQGCAGSTPAPGTEEGSGCRLK